MHVFDEIIQIEHRRRKNLLPAECQKLPRQRRGAVAGFFNFSDVLAQRILRSQRANQHLAVSDNHSQQIVEVVCDSSGESAHRFHFPRHAQLFFQNAFVGDVLYEHLEKYRIILFAGEPPPIALHGDGRAVFPFPFGFHVMAIVAAIQQFNQPGKFRGKSENFQLQVSLQQLQRSVVAQHLLQRRVDAQQPPLIVGAIDSVWRIFHHGAKPRVRQPQRFLGEFALGDVAIHDHHFFRDPLGIADHAGGGLQNSPVSILVANAVLEGLPFASNPCVRSRLLHAFKVLGMDLRQRRASFQLLRRISQHRLVRHAVVDSAPFHVHHRDHVRSVVADQPEQFFTLKQLAANPVNLQLLVNGVNIEKQHHRDQSSDRNRKRYPRNAFGMFAKLRHDERDDSHRQ